MWNRASRAYFTTKEPSYFLLFCRMWEGCYPKVSRNPCLPEYSDIWHDQGPAQVALTDAYYCNGPNNNSNKVAISTLKRCFVAWICFRVLFIHLFILIGINSYTLLEMLWWFLLKESSPKKFATLSVFQTRQTLDFWIFFCQKHVLLFFFFRCDIWSGNWFALFNFSFTIGLIQAITNLAFHSCIDFQDDLTCNSKAHCILISK